MGPDKLQHLLFYLIAHNYFQLIIPIIIIIWKLRVSRGVRGNV